MSLLNVILFVLSLVVVYVAFRKLGSQEILVEKGGDIVTIRRLRITKEVIKYLLVAGFLLILSIVVRIVPDGKVAIIRDYVLGRTYVRYSGMMIVVPFLMDMTTYSLRIRMYPKNKPITIWATSKDGIGMGASLRVFYTVDEEDPVRFHKLVGDREEKLVESIVKSSVKNNISKFSGYELYTFSRERFADEVFKDLKRKLSSYGISVKSVEVSEIKASPEFSKKLEEIALVKQEIEKLRKELDKKNIEEDLIRRDAEIKAMEISIIGRALKRYPEYINYLYIQKLSDKVEVIVKDENILLSPESFRK